MAVHLKEGIGECLGGAACQVEEPGRGEKVLAKPVPLVVGQARDRQEVLHLLQDLQHILHKMKEEKESSKKFYCTYIVPDKTNTHS